MQILKETEVKETAGGGIDTQDLSSFIGKPLKDFLSTKGNFKVGLNYQSKGYYGSDGLSGMAHDINWSCADKKIASLKKGDGKYYEYEITIE